VSSWAGGLARAAAAPVLCAAVLIGLLSGWVSSGGAGTIARVRIEITLAAIPLPRTSSQAFTRVYLTIRNKAAQADVLSAASTPAARRVSLRPVIIPARATVTLTPFGADLMLIGVRHLAAGQHVPLTLIFRHAGRITVQATVTAPGAP
jgi:copper(I)-binding protein